jgi:hypothetical protein
MVAHLVSLAIDTLTPSVSKESNMSFSLGLLLYMTLGLSLSLLRISQGVRSDDALFVGLFWPLDLMRRWIDVLIGVLLRAGLDNGMA